MENTHFSEPSRPSPAWRCRPCFGPRKSRQYAFFPHFILDFFSSIYLADVSQQGRDGGRDLCHVQRGVIILPASLRRQGLPGQDAEFRGLKKCLLETIGLYRFVLQANLIRQKSLTSFSSLSGGMLNKMEESGKRICFFLFYLHIVFYLCANLCLSSAPTSPSRPPPQSWAGPPRS